jgi:electron transfer flavoprotein beta subunit
MKILVTVKRVIDYNVKPRVKPDGSGVVTDGVAMIVNPFDEIAVEEALRLKEKNPPSEVVVLTVGSKDATAQVRQALAMGADRGILVLHDGPVDPDAVARLLKAVWDQEKPDLVILGKQAIDDDSNVVGQLLAEYAGLPQACFASQVTLAGKTLTVSREVDGGQETLSMDLPAVVTADLRLNTPRYASLPGIMKAKKKEVKEFTPAALGVDVSPKVKVLKLEEPKMRQAGQKVPDVATLVQKLHEEAKAV